MINYLFFLMIIGEVNFILVNIMLNYIINIINLYFNGFILFYLIFCFGFMNE